MNQSPAYHNPTSIRRYALGCRLTALALLMATTPLLAKEAKPDDPNARPPAADPSPQSAAAILPLQGEITDITFQSLKRRVAEAVSKGVATIIFDMDTPGGLVSSSIQIADLIKNLEGVKTVAWVNPNAHSGGSIVAVACDEIVMAKSSRMGDSQVIMGGPGGASAVPEELQAKAYTPVLAEFRASARLRGYDQVLCEAFVLPDREVWWLENVETGEREFVRRAEKLKRMGERELSETTIQDAEDPDPVPHQTKKETDGHSAESTKTADSSATQHDEAAKTADAGDPQPSPTKPQWKLVETYHDPILDMDTEVFQPVVRADQLLEMSASEAHAYGFSQGIVRNEDQLRTRYSLAKILRIERTWSENLAYWMTSMYVRGFLMVIIMLAAYVEFHTPGVGVPGLVALIGLGIFVGAPYLTGAANVWEILIIIIGVALIALEMFVIPGFGVAGISGILFVIVGLLATFVPDEPGRSFPIYIPSLPGTIEAFKTGVVTLASSFFASLLGMVVLSRVLPKTMLFRAIVPANPTPADIAPDDAYRGAAHLGNRGTAKSQLHPAGKALFGSVLVDVVSRGEIIDAGTEIEVIKRRGHRVVVRAVE